MARPTTVIAQVTNAPRSPAARGAADARPSDRAQPDQKPATARSTRRPNVEVAPVIRSKIQAPVLRPDTLSRNRLLDRLRESVRSRVTLVIADAGYGKTTLLADFASRSGLRMLWYRLESTDADIVTWTNYLIAAGREIDPAFGDATSALLSQMSAGGPPKPAAIASLIGELAKLGETPTVLVLDDFHLVDQNAEVRDIVKQLIANAPQWLRFVISARRKPQLEWARLAGMGELTDLATDDLRFSAEETERLFAESYGQPIEPDILAELDRRTKGWAASLQLFHGSVRGRPSSAVRALAHALSGATGPIYDFLAEEVLANLPDHLEDFLVRCSIIERITASTVAPLFVDLADRPSSSDIHGWIEQGDRLGLLNKSSQSSEVRQLHPLLRDFLGRQLSQRYSSAQIAAMHLGVALALANSDPLTACHHYIEAGHQAEAMDRLGSSVLLTMGSGQWGVAAELVDRLKDEPANPAVSAIRGRALIEAGQLTEAEALLTGLDVADSAPDIRAIVRQTLVSLDWRLGELERLYATLRDIGDDPETPPIVRDIAQIFIDASPAVHPPAPLPDLAARLVAMARAQQEAGHHFYAAISLNNAAVAYMNAAEYTTAIAVAQRAVHSFELLAYPAPERLSTLSVIAMCHTELGNVQSAQDYIDASMATGREYADVPASLAMSYAAQGRRTESDALLGRAEALDREGRSDVTGMALVDSCRALLALDTNPGASAALLAAPSLEAPLDLGYHIARRALLAQALLLDRQPEQAGAAATLALTEARRRKVRRYENRLAIISALIAGDPIALRRAIHESPRSGRLGILEIAEAIGTFLDVCRVPEVERSIREFPARWRPVLRRQLEGGDHAPGQAAAELLDEFGGLEDVVPLRAYAKTYRKRGAGKSIGRDLARRASPKLRIHDLGRVTLEIGHRSIPISSIRRRAAALLIYLVTRPNFTATRDQVVDELWPDADPGSATNSLNQTLYFLRREIDPWYEDDVSADYISFQGDLVWLDRDLVRADSAEFLQAADSRSTANSPESDVDLLEPYRGQFAPDFEYEEWAQSWRSRLHSTYLEVADACLSKLVSDGELRGARSVASAALQVDPAALDVERRLVSIYWHLGQRGAARAQYKHLLTAEQAEGWESITLAEIVGLSPRH